MAPGIAVVVVVGLNAPIDFIVRMEDDAPEFRRAGKTGAIDRDVDSADDGRVSATGGVEKKNAADSTTPPPTTEEEQEDVVESSKEASKREEAEVSDDEEASLKRRHWSTRTSQGTSFETCYSEKGVLNVRVPGPKLKQKYTGV